VSDNTEERRWLMQELHRTTVGYAASQVDWRNIGGELQNAVLQAVSDEFWSREGWTPKTYQEMFVRVANEFDTTGYDEDLVACEKEAALLTDRKEELLARLAELDELEEGAQ